MFLAITLRFTILIQNLLKVTSKLKLVYIKKIKIILYNLKKFLIDVAAKK